MGRSEKNQSRPEQTKRDKQMGSSDKLRLIQVLVILLCSLDARGDPLYQGKWELLLENAGVSAMHMMVLHTNKVLIFDQTFAGPSQIRRTDPPCNSRSPPASQDCWAHSVEYDIASNQVRPLHVVTDTWCSSGAFTSNGMLVQLGGSHDGENITRYFTPCYHSACSWVESTVHLAAPRWYASSQILPDDRVMVVGGRSQFNYEFIPKRANGEGVFSLPFLAQTTDIEENNLYPFLHLSSDGNLFIFAHRDSILLDYKNYRVLKNFPTMPGGGSRNYPSTGSSVMLPLSAADNFHRVEIIICGGAPKGTFRAAMAKNFRVVFKSCGRLVITSPNPVWQMENMPGRRILSDMLILPTGDIILINGAQLGSAGYQCARSPVLSPFLYKPAEPVGKRFTVLAPARIPRMYHSTASVLPDGRVLVAGSNPNYGYHFSDVPFSTELRVEAYIPYYLDPYYDSKRPTIHSISERTIRFGSNFTVGFSLPVQPKSSAFRFHAYAPPFTTHSFSMNQRMLSLRAAISVSRYSYSATLTAPPSPVAAPSGYYMLSVVNGDVPSKAEWIRFVN
ncbi:hypothetical protein SUGI_0086980 [Cryptomeria japonica]|uniref:aldehyde oxidase GLOX n=1 Tax=Cryptomeria japonica TaxID=3369 RepID=UPI002408A0D2|nr:aldehyde oxidase GLOX [Cryptomeria japonica]GLJ08352.1 hypothetical protein SUGI_0086980 [Cryptomeria japonica]